MALIFSMNISFIVFALTAIVFLVKSSISTSRAPSPYGASSRLLEVSPLRFTVPTRPSFISKVTSFPPPFAVYFA
jgi:hypothetical protein